MKKIRIIGAGLAGSEAALQFGNAGWEVELFEMRPQTKTQAHKTGLFAEMVCSNSLKSKLPSTASGLLKKEMKMLGSKLLPIAEECALPAGGALAVDRDIYAEKVTAMIKSNKNIKIIGEEYTTIDHNIKTIIATGPLTSDKLMGNIRKLIGENQLYFFDSIAPIISADSINYDIAYKKNRYQDEEGDYLNCPFDKEQYYSFVEELRNAKKHEAHEFENEFFNQIKFNFYENCIPIEELARRGVDTLKFGVMRPVGLTHPQTQIRPHAVIQLRTENEQKTSLNLVGCQTMMTYPEQKRVLKLIPGLEKAEFLRYGSIHQNLFINAPNVLTKNLSLIDHNNIFLTGQIAGVEGYVESIFAGLLTFLIIEKNLESLPVNTISFNLWKHLQTKTKKFQPMNANFGLLPPLKEKIRDKKEKKLKYYERAVCDLDKFIKDSNL